ncbi:MAG: Nif3-like dinuclear metal center hexameric protein [Bacteroidales bacterium 45-6]|nr:MAG: Nif3-like dinuclear metal center hexameric protein [Bacteroidales bacterium 45-6]
MRIRELLQTIEQIAPLPLQESFDNSGVQVGDTNQEAKGVLVCIDVTENVILEAVNLNCNLVVSHHPIAFRSFKSLTGKTYVERSMILAIKHDIVLYAAHTNLDNALQGINSHLAEMLNLQNVRILSPQKNNLLKLATFAPTTYAEAIRNALFNAGAGHIGNYDSCSYNLEGKGTFRAGKGTHPFCGNIGEIHTEQEVRIETILPAFRQKEVLRALMAVHPYEEPAYDLYPLANDWSGAGSGVVGTLPEEMDEEEFLYLLKDTFRLTTLQHSPFKGTPVRDVAICGGSGAFLIPKAMAYGADVFITGEAKYNDFYDVEDKLLLATIGHYESEVCSKEIFFDVLSKKYPTFAIHKSGFDINPVNYL